MARLTRTLALSGRFVLLLIPGPVVAEAARNDHPGQMTQREIVEFNARAHAEAGHKWCGTGAVTATLKFDLFRQATKVRGGDAALFERAARYSVLRIEHPLVISEQKVGLLFRCTAAASLKLARGFAVRGGHRTLSAHIGYNTDFNGTKIFNYETDFRKYDTNLAGLVVTATDADAIVTPLATLSPAFGARVRLQRARMEKWR